MTARQLTSVATDTARSIRRMLAAAAEREPPLRVIDVTAEEIELEDEQADEAGLDALRGELVRELDRLAAGDDGCSASFRRV